MTRFGLPLADRVGGFFLPQARRAGPSEDREPAVAASLEAHGLVKAFDAGRVPVLNGISVHAEAGEFVAILGPSGCGKSTLLSILAGLLEADAGSIAVADDPHFPRRGRLAYMPQQDALFPWRTVLDNCTLPAEFQGRDRRAARREALDLLREFGLGGFAHAYPAALSGGMRQRAAFLRTWLAHQPILLLDEPFGALDALTRSALQQWLLDVWERRRRTVLLVTHDIEEAILLADRIYVLSERPARVTGVFAAPFARPRPETLVLNPEFLRLKATLLGTLRADLPARSRQG